MQGLPPEGDAYQTLRDALISLIGERLLDITTTNVPGDADAVLVTFTFSNGQDLTLRLIVTEDDAIDPAIILGGDVDDLEVLRAIAALPSPAAPTTAATPPPPDPDDEAFRHV